MPRALSATITAEIAKPAPDRAYLVEFGFSTVLRVASTQQIDWDDKTWYPLGIIVEPASLNECAFELRNHDNAVSALVLAQPLDAVEVRVFEWYDGDAVEIFTGTLDDAPEIGARVRLTARSHSGAPTYPTERIAAPVFNHITRAGTVVKWGNGTLELEAGPQ